VLVWVDNSFAANFGRLDEFKQFMFVSDKSVVFLLGAEPTTEYDLTIRHEITTQKLANIVAVLPGKAGKTNT
jgi:hypothetical protein